MLWTLRYESVMYCYYYYKVEQVSRLKFVQNSLCRQYFFHLIFIFYSYLLDSPIDSK